MKIKKNQVQEILMKICFKLKIKIIQKETKPYLKLKSKIKILFKQEKALN